MKFIRIIAMVIITAILAVPSAQTGQEKTDQAYNAITDRFFAMLSENKPGEAVEYILGLNPYMKGKADDIEKAKAQLSSAAAMLGNYQGKELLGEKPFGARVVNLTYLAYYDRQPIRLTFQFYKLKETWSTFYFNFDDGFSAELMAAGKAESMVSPECRNK